MNNTDFPQNKLQRRIYDFWSARGYSKATAVLGNLNVHLHHENPQYESLGIDYIYLEQFYNFAQEDVWKQLKKKPSTKRIK
jgi:hypothetical protein